MGSGVRTGSLLEDGVAFNEVAGFWRLRLSHPQKGAISHMPERSSEKDDQTWDSIQLKLLEARTNLKSEKPLTQLVNVDQY